MLNSKNKHITTTDSVHKDFNVVTKKTNDNSVSKSLFSNHLLESRNNKPKIHYTNYEYWVAGILFISFVVYVWLYVSNRKRLSQVVKGFYINRIANQLMREEFSVINKVSIFLSILFIFTVSLFVNQLASYYHISIGTNSLTFFFIVALLIVIIYGIKLIGIRILGHILKLQKESGDYITTVFLFCNTTSLFMFPVVICLAFLKQLSPIVFIYIGFGVLLGFILTRIIRGLIIGLNSSRVSKLYLFVYLCTLEILPILIVTKILMLKINI